jgi:hypothetical protein
MRTDRRAYYRERAEAEIAAADRAEHPEARTAHSMLAGFYLDLAHNGEWPGIDGGQPAKAGG